VEPEDSVQWRASRAFVAGASVGLLIALWFPWFHVGAFLIASPDQELTAKGGFAAVSLTAWEVSTPISFVIAIAAFAALVVAANGELGPDGRWLEATLGVYWLAAALALLSVSAIAFGMVSLPSSVTERCAAQTALGSPGSVTANPCQAGTAVVHSQLLFGAGISVALAVLLVAAVAWGTARQPGNAAR
jgi:hypothetical protein